LLAGFWVFGNKICQTVGDEIFFPPHIILGIDKQRDLGNKICQTVGDAREKKIECIYHCFAAIRLEGGNVHIES
jgi:hypothetical protein